MSALGVDFGAPTVNVDTLRGHKEKVITKLTGGLAAMANDPRVVDSTGALELKEVPKRMPILGGGIIGLEMGTVYSTLGARLDVVEMMDGLMQGADRDLVKIWQKMNAPRFDNIMLKTKTVGARALPEGIEVTFAAAEEGGTAPAPQVYDLVLQAVGRTPNGTKLAAIGRARSKLYWLSTAECCTPGRSANSRQ